MIAVEIILNDFKVRNNIVPCVAFGPDLFGSRSRSRSRSCVQGPVIAGGA